MSKDAVSTEKRSSGRRLSVPEGETLLEVFLSRARLSPDRVIASDRMSGQVTYRRLVTSIFALMPEFRRMEGEYVGILLPAGVAAISSTLASLFAGKTPVMINWTAGPAHVKHAIRSLDIKKVVTADRFLKRLSNDLKEIDGSAEFFMLDEFSRSLSKARKLKAGIGARLSWRRLRRMRPPGNAVILFTSGSENRPKAVPLTHGNILANIRDLAERIRLSENDVLLGLLPPFHAFGVSTTMFLPLCLGLRAAYHPNPLEKRVLAGMIKEHSVSLLVGTPTFLSGIARASTGGEMDSLRLAVLGAEKCPHSVFDLIEKRCPNLKVIEGYGITECSPVVSVCDESSPLRGAVGRVLPSLEHAVVDPELRGRVKSGDTGMLLLRGPSVFKGYIGHDGPSPFVDFEDSRWYETGDLVSEEDGNLVFRGRLKRFVKIGGEMVSLPAVEQVIRERFPSDDDDFIHAVEAIEDGSRPRIALFTTMELSREDVNASIREAGLSSLHNVREVVHLDEIPRLGSGKVDYRALRAMLVRV